MSFGILRLLLTTDFQTSLPLTTRSKNLLQSELGVRQTINSRVGGSGWGGAGGCHKSSAVTVSIRPQRSLEVRQHILCLLCCCTTAPVGGIVNKQRAKKIKAAVQDTHKNDTAIRLLQTNYANHSFACTVDIFFKFAQ